MQNNIILIGKKTVRRICGIRTDESFSDGIIRLYCHYKKKLPHHMIGKNELDDCIEKLGITSGDIIVLHSAWRSMYKINMSPKNFLDYFLDKIGEEGTLLMPCYGTDPSFFCKKDTPSHAGVLSELLRLREGSVRSTFPKFSMVGYGPKAEYFLNSHIQSKYQFDQDSPYGKIARDSKAKIVLIGLGSKPHKISIFHCASFDSRYSNVFYEKCYSLERSAHIIDESGAFDINYIDRLPQYQNNKRAFRKLFSGVNKKTENICGLDFMCFSSKEAYQKAYEFCTNGGKIYTVQ